MVVGPECVRAAPGSLSFGQTDNKNPPQKTTPSHRRRLNQSFCLLVASEDLTSDLVLAESRTRASKATSRENKSVHARRRKLRGSKTAGRDGTERERAKG